MPSISTDHISTDAISAIIGLFYPAGLDAQISALDDFSMASRLLLRPIRDHGTCDRYQQTYPGDAQSDQRHVVSHGPSYPVARIQRQARPPARCWHCVGLLILRKRTAHRHEEDSNL